MNFLGWGNPDITMKSAMNGAYFESFVVSEIVKSYFHAGKDAVILLS